ncbi:MAG: helix-turn-helix domain-containing protein [Gemmatimonadota bacterium]|nr:helix-turn-helix domain-containing protein [Gemmatimonadota bacterium]
MALRHWLTAEQVLQRVPVHVRTLRRWVANGTFPQPYRFGPSGRVTRWDEAEVEAWVEEQRAPAEVEA